ncbi:MAG: efflux RND transporter periplasmic adaptor subunit [Rickettsiales bacterium]|jgi:HlyD family secretion protein|nr:efflux RND transporter periplasmic adaptor subunit [Rickettsiales bacterium]
MNSKKILGKIEEKKTLIVAFATFLLVLSALFIFLRMEMRTFKIKYFDVEEVTLGKIDKIITASGIINPIDIVSVGCLTNGVVKKMYVDYNDKVEKDQKLADLDANIKELEVEAHEADARRSEASYKLAEAELKRMKELYRDKHVSKREIEMAENEATAKHETFKIAALNLEKSKVELEQYHIKSPISGVVVARPVDEGQAVVSNSTAQTLYKIAKDLSKMQIEASVSEADVGLIKNDLEIVFTVDAYKNNIFRGKIKQIRLDPVYEQNVVMYIVVIDVDNSGNLLLPGMTAFVSIKIDSVAGAIKVPNTVFKFRPSTEARLAMRAPELTTNRKIEIAEKIRTGNYAYIYVIRNGRKNPEGLLVRKGISDLEYTEIKSEDLKAGDKVISAYLKKTKGKK